MSAWKLYDELIAAIPEDVTVVAAAAGERWCNVVSSEGGLGIAHAFPVESRSPLRDPSTFAGASLREIAELSKSWNFVEAGIGVAAVNAWYSQPERAAGNGFTRTEQQTWVEVFDPFSEAVAGKVVSVVGHFPFAPQPLAKAAELFVLERRTRPGDFPDSACEYLLPESDYVFISGSGMVNKTLPRLLELSRDATTVVLGPSTPMSDLLFDHGADVLTGFAAAVQPGALDLLGGTIEPGMADDGYRVEKHKEATADPSVQERN